MSSRFTNWVSRVNVLLAISHGVEILDMPDTDLYWRWESGMSAGVAVADMIEEWRNDGAWYDDDISESRVW